MKKLVITSVLAVSFAVAGSISADGKSIFTSKGCTTCHHPTKDQSKMGLGPSLQQIAKAYKGNQKGLVNFLKGNGKPKIYPDKYPIMQGQLAMIKGLSNGQLNSLAAYLLKH